MWWSLWAIISLWSVNFNIFQQSISVVYYIIINQNLQKFLIITPLANTFEQLPWQYSWNHSPYEYSGRTFSPATSNAWLCTWLVLFDFISSLNHTIFLPIEWKHKKVNQVKFNDFIWHKYRPNISTLSF